MSVDVLIASCWTDNNDEVLARRAFSGVDEVQQFVLLLNLFFLQMIVKFFSSNDQR